MIIFPSAIVQLAECDTERVWGAGFSCSEWRVIESEIGEEWEIGREVVLGAGR